MEDFRKEAERIAAEHFGENDDISAADIVEKFEQYEMFDVSEKKFETYVLRDLKQVQLAQ